MSEIKPGSWVRDRHTLELLLVLLAGKFVHDCLGLGETGIYSDAVDMRLLTPSSPTPEELAAWTGALARCGLSLTA